MAKCDSKGFVVRLDQVGKLKNDDLIAISILDDLASCAKIDTRTITKDSNANLTSGYYNAANVPEDEFGCSKNKCYNTGTFQGTVTAAETAVTFGDFKKTMDATLYAAGIVTAYVLLPQGDHQVSLTLADYTAAGYTDSSTSTVTVHATKSGTGSVLYPVKFDLTEFTNTGDGWTPSTVGVLAKVTIESQSQRFCWCIFDCILRIA